MEFGKLIEVKVLAATDTKGCRYKATWRWGGAIHQSKTEGRNYSLNPEVQATRLAEKFASEIFKFEHKLIGAHTESGWVFIVQAIPAH